MKTIEELRALASYQINAGNFPLARNLKSVSGEHLMMNRRCSLCCKSIEAGDFAYRLVANSQKTLSDQVVNALHFECHAAWQLSALKEVQIAVNIVDPAIYSVYADCRWGIGLSREDWLGTQDACQKVMDLFEKAQDDAVIGFADLPDLCDNAMGQGIIELGEYDNGEVRPLVDVEKARVVIDAHILMLSDMAAQLGDSAGNTRTNLRALRALLVEARQGLSSAAAHLDQVAVA
jgi:hypothetical protein